MRPQRCAVAFIGQANAGHAPIHRRRHQPRDASRRVSKVQTGRPDIRHAIPLGIRAPAPRFEGEVRTEAVRGAEPRSLTDQHHHKSRTKTLADVIADGHASLRRDHRRR